MRVAAVAYLNTLPLTYGLPWTAEGMLPAQMVPERLATFDLILAPVVASILDPTWQVLTNGPAVGCMGAVGSVRLDLAPGQTIDTAQRFALSPESRTSNLLLKVLLARCWGHDLRELHFHTGDVGQPCDARLIIGDTALATPAAGDSIDLGGAWHKWTGLAFVFATWMHRAVLPDDVAPTLCRIRDHNLVHREAMLRATGHDPVRYHHYFTNQLVYEFGPAQVQGLARFREELQQIADVI